MFAIAWEYLTGRAVATDPTDRLAAEWPPHPDRVFQSLVAAWGEVGEDAGERDALAWLAALAIPQVAVPLEMEEDEAGCVIRCAVPKVFVPVNDLEGVKRGAYGDKHIGLLPARRTRKERYFPSVHLGSACCALLWPDAVAPDRHRVALERLCSGVTHLGHSSSVVRMWVTDAPPSPAWTPAGEGERRDVSLRVPDQYRLKALIAAFAGGGVGWRRPPTARWQPYRRFGHGETAMPRGQFDDRLLVLRQVAGPRLHLPQTKELCAALHKTLIKKSDGWTPEIVSGHEPGGGKTKLSHLGFFPLAHVGREYADGHLLGLALALPRCLSWEDEEAVYRTVAATMDTERAAVRLTLGALGAVTLAVEDRPAPPHALRPATWCRSARRWGTVTPFVLDRLPPRGVKDADAWAVSQIAVACLRQGLPEPREIDLLAVSPCLGAPAARDFPAMIRKEDGGKRWHLHAEIVFPTAIGGPLVMGAGRFRGYGLCRPLS